MSHDKLVIKTPIEGLLIINPEMFGDERGFFFESYNERRFADLIGQEVHFVQDNHSRSSKNVLRGMHFQIQQPQGKLVRVVRGCVWDVAVDLRINSKTFGKSFGCELSEFNHQQIWIPPGFAHGFLGLSDSVDFLYKTTAYWAPGFERSLLWNDPRVGVDWPLSDGQLPVLAPKDAAGLSLDALLQSGELRDFVST